MKKFLALAVIASVVFGLLIGCSQNVQSVSGTKMKTAGTIKTNSNDRTVEQQNIYDRINMDNQPGSIKHLYVISAYSGQVIIYSTVKGKVTSSNKRLTPDVVTGTGDFQFEIDGYKHYTNEVLGEDGTYGKSAEYLFWWDSRGNYHQHYVQGGQILHISDQPIAVKSVVINMEVSAKDGG